MLKESYQDPEKADQAMTKDKTWDKSREERSNTENRRSKIGTASLQQRRREEYNAKDKEVKRGDREDKRKWRVS